ncbi:uncharacterized protein LOC119769165 [Culex quinquefasciatus]|uniref:uncharacterized protein LOC119769165 n=1 Tax=Culex quinquefasciatus TaxID=7176 RepID=UPI0018E3C419|nr:uncharacterized protein LOC119769165 [Culex quinquefasciatus]
MYRQVLVDQRHTPLQHVFWRTDPTKPLRVLELTTVTYGTASAPFLATRALQQLARDEKHRFPLAAKIIEEDFYVDNALFGFDDILQASEAQSQLIQLCKAGGFELHKWSSSCPELLEAIPEADREELVSVGGTGTKEVIKALGLLWNPAADELQFAPLPSKRGGRPTKSQVLSRVANIFDPAGIAAPVVLVGKLLMERIWEKEIGWNQQIPEEPGPRQDSSAATRTELAELNLLCAKSKLVPKTVKTIPRSELLAARLLHRLVKNVLEAVDFVFRKIVLWSDSQVVLAWLKKKPDQLEVFVKNRVAEIVATGGIFEWKYVRTADNPADIVSRGMSATKLATNEKWKKCAEYQRSEICEMEEPEPLPDDAVPELCRDVVVSAAIQYETFQPTFERIESFRELQRIFAYVVRFCRNCKEMVKERRIVSR